MSRRSLYWVAGPAAEEEHYDVQEDWIIITGRIIIIYSDEETALLM